jgi:Ca2+/Na+ antiporter
VTWRLIGAALIGFAAGSWLAFRARVWERVRIAVYMDMVWSALGALVILWGILFEGLPPLEWLNVILLAAFAAAFIIFYVRLEHPRRIDEGGSR